MDFSLPEQQRQLQDSVSGTSEQLSPLDRVRRLAEGRELMAREVWEGLVELGDTGLLIPEQHGGLGLEVLDAALVAEMLGRYVAPAPFAATCVMAPLALLGAGSPAQQPSGCRSSPPAKSLQAWASPKPSRARATTPA